MPRQYRSTFYAMDLPLYAVLPEYGDGFVEGVRLISDTEVEVWIKGRAEPLRFARDDRVDAISPTYRGGNLKTVWEA